MNTLKIQSNNVVDESPPKSLAFSIINPQWITNTNSEATGDLIRQIVIYLTFNDKLTSNDEKIKKIGLLQALTKFSSNFLDSYSASQLSFIDTDKSRTIVNRLDVGDDDSPYWFFWDIQFAHSGDTFSHKGLADPDYFIILIQDAYKLWKLNNGSLNNCENLWGKELLQNKLTDWWSTWFRHKFEFSMFYSVTDNGFLKLLNGVKYSSVKLPIGFRKNLKRGIDDFIRDKNGLVGFISSNTNWTPEKNWGTIYLHGNNIFTEESIKSLINWIEMLDCNFGLSTYALTYGNLPSLKNYADSLKRLDSIKPNGGVLERSLMEPAIYLQQKLSTHVFDPFTKTIDTISSYMPSINTPFPSLWGSAENSILPEISNESSADSRTTNSSFQSSLGVAAKLGSYLLGNTKGDSIQLHEIYLDLKTNNEKKFKLIMYEINGILFTLIYELNTPFLSDLSYYQSLSSKLNGLYDLYFADLIVNQLKSLEQDMQINPDFSYIIFDNGDYWTSINNIPDDEMVLEYKFFREEKEPLISRTQALGLNKQLQNLITNFPTPITDWQVNEKLVKLNKNYCCLYKQLNENKWVIIMKKLNGESDISKTEGSNVIMFGDKVSNWLKWVIDSGYK